MNAREWDQGYRDGLYGRAAVPMDEADEYLAGYRTGWLDRRPDHRRSAR